jgi:deoxyribonuclease-1
MNMLVLVLIFVSSAFAQQNQKLPSGQWAFYGEEFYQALASDNKIGKQLISNILGQTHTYSDGCFDVIAPVCKNGGHCYSHQSVSYDKARKIMFGELDILKDSQGTYVLDVYCERKIYFTDVASASRSDSHVNIEHTWPQSKFSSKFPKDVQKSDMHHLYLADSSANSYRGNNPFGFVSESENRMGGEGCKTSQSGISQNSEVYTPPVSHRGNVARSLFYFSMHYNLEISKEEETVLREWHKNDPVDEKEILRHEGISKYQKIRNPFIDYPELVDRVSDF